MEYGKQLRSIDEQLEHFAKEHDSGGVDVCLRVKELERAILSMSNMGEIDKQKFRECYELVKPVTQK